MTYFCKIQFHIFSFPGQPHISIYINSKIPILRPPFGLLKSGLNSEVVLLLNTISYEKYHLGLAKIGLNREVVLISGGLNSKILLCIYI